MRAQDDWRIGSAKRIGKTLRRIAWGRNAPMLAAAVLVSLTLPRRCRS